MTARNTQPAPFLYRKLYTDFEVSDSILSLLVDPSYKECQVVHVLDIGERSFDTFDLTLRGNNSEPTSCTHQADHSARWRQGSNHMY